MTSSNRNISRVITRALYGESNGQRWPFTDASDAELWRFRWPAPEQTFQQNTRTAGDLRCHHAHYDVTVMYCHVSPGMILTRLLKAYVIFPVVAWLVKTCFFFQDIVHQNMKIIVTKLNVKFACSQLPCLWKSWHLSIRDAAWRHICWSTLVQVVALFLIFNYRVAYILSHFHRKVRRNGSLNVFEKYIFWITLHRDYWFEHWICTKISWQDAISHYGRLIKAGT